MVRMPLILAYIITYQISIHIIIFIITPRRKFRINRMIWIGITDATIKIISSMKMVRIMNKQIMENSIDQTTNRMIHKLTKMKEMIIGKIQMRMKRSINHSQRKKMTIVLNNLSSPRIQEWKHLMMKRGRNILVSKESDSIGMVIKTMKTQMEKSMELRNQSSRNLINHSSSESIIWTKESWL